LDKRLTFKPHIQQTRRTGLKTLAALKTILHSNTSEKIKTRLYLAILRPIATHGFQLYSSKTYTKLLSKFERYWIRVSYLMWQDTEQLLYNRAQIIKMEDYMANGRKEYIHKAIGRKFINMHFPRRMNKKQTRHAVTNQELLELIH